ncbi:MAG: PrsW family intramembrane metalloprotease [Muribaculaceae bacterium]|nr:PrsW family intramembrane metalloprotease [Muribaculaceae bacterium]
MSYYIIRNGKEYGPYDLQSLTQYVQSGKILKHDMAREASTSECNTVDHFFRSNNVKVKVANKGSFVDQLKAIGAELIIPLSLFRSRKWLSDKRLLLLALIGLGPSLIMILPISGFMVFYAVALYFSTIWGLFFYYFFKTDQVSIKTTLLVFFSTQGFVFLIWDILGLPNLNPFYSLIDTTFLLKLVGYTLGVGFTEEFVKLLPLLIIYRLAKQPLQPKTLVFYGLISGIAFGVFEGVQYQMSVNINYDYTSSFFMNIARLTSLPFIHAVWTGIAGYFIGFAKLYPLYRHALYFLCIAVPSILHGLYDTFCGYPMGMFIALPIMFIGVFLLMTYLKQGQNYQSKLIQ